MRTIFRIVLTIVLISIIYAIIWYVIAIDLCSNINNLREGDKKNFSVEILNQEMSFSFDKVVPYGFPFKLGVKFINLCEESIEPLTQQKYITNHKGLVTVSYDFLKSGFVFSNKGESLLRLKPVSSGFGVRIISNNSYFAQMPLSKDLLNICKNQSQAFELINFIKTIQIKASGIKIYDLVNNTLLYDHKNTDIELSWDRSTYYTTLEEFKNNIPKSYDLTLNLDISKVSQEKKIIAPFSLIYFLLGNSEMKATLQANLQTNGKTLELKEISDNMNLNIKKLDLLTPQAKVNFVSNIILDNNSLQENCSFQFDLDIDFYKIQFDQFLMNKFFEQISKKYAIYSSNNFLSESFSQKSPIQIKLDQPYNLRFSTDGNYLLSKKLKNLNLKTFYIMLNNETGLNIKGHHSFITHNNWYIDVNLLLYNYKKMTDSIINLCVKYKKFDSLAIDNINKSVNLLLRSISSYTTSNSHDLSIDIQLSNDISSSKIGHMPLSLLLEKYKSLNNF